MFDGYWYGVKDGDERAFALFSRHYSYHQYKDNRRLTDKRIIGPCRDRLVLLGRDCLALFVWKLWDDPSGQEGIYCSVFRNEGKRLSSELILEAEQLALQHWPFATRFYTYVDAKKVRARFFRKPRPGRCFIEAGWRKLPEVTKKNGLLIFEKLPER